MNKGSEIKCPNPNCNNGFVKVIRINSRGKKVEHEMKCKNCHGTGRIPNSEQKPPQEEKYPNREEIQKKIKDTLREKYAVEADDEDEYLAIEALTDLFMSETHDLVKDIYGEGVAVGLKLGENTGKPPQSDSKGSGSVSIYSNSCLFYASKDDMCNRTGNMCCYEKKPETVSEQEKRVWYQLLDKSVRKFIDNKRIYTIDNGDVLIIRKGKITAISPKCEVTVESNTHKVIIVEKAVAEIIKVKGERDNAK